MFKKKLKPVIFKKITFFHLTIKRIDISFLKLTIKLIFKLN